MGDMVVSCWDDDFGIAALTTRSFLKANLAKV